MRIRYKQKIKPPKKKTRQKVKITARAISFAVTAYEEFNNSNKLTHLDKCLEWPLQDKRIKEIVIVDDCSNDYNKLKDYIKSLNNNKIKLYRNKKNLGVFNNKIEAVKKATLDWVVLIDSDNYINKQFIDAIFNEKWEKDIIYCPSFARPKFDFRHLINQIVSLENIKSFLEQRRRILNKNRIFFNTCNYFFNRLEYLKILKDINVFRFDLLLPNYVDIIDRDQEEVKKIHDAIDTAIVNKLWLFNNKKFKIVENMEYIHTIDSTSYSIRSPKTELPLYNRCMDELLETPFITYNFRYKLFKELKKSQLKNVLLFNNNCNVYIIEIFLELLKNNEFDLSLCTEDKSFTPNIYEKVDFFAPYMFTDTTLKSILQEHNFDCIVVDIKDKQDSIELYYDLLTRNKIKQFILYNGERQKIDDIKKQNKKYKSKNIDGYIIISERKK